MKALTAKNHRSMHSHAQANENLWIEGFFFFPKQFVDKVKYIHFRKLKG
jgi:hypothetical protein